MNLETDLKKEVDKTVAKIKADLKKAKISDTGQLIGSFKAKVTQAGGKHRVRVQYREYGLILQHQSYLGGKTKVQLKKRRYRIIARNLRIMEDALVELVALHYEGLFVETINF